MSIFFRTNFLDFAFMLNSAELIKTVGLYHRAVSDTVSGEILHGSALDIGHELHPKIGRIAFLVFGNSNKDCLFSSGTTALTGNISLAACSEVGIITFYNALQTVMRIPHLHGSPDPAQKIPGGFVAHFDFPRQGKGRDTALVAGHQINCPEPLGQGGDGCGA